MQSEVRDAAPQANETLAKYIQRLRSESTSTQKELSLKAGIHIQTIRKIEAGLTNRLNQKAKSGLAAALSIPQDYLDAVVKKVPVATISALKFCPQCWTPGTTRTSRYSGFNSFQVVLGEAKLYQAGNASSRQC